MFKMMRIIQDLDPRIASPQDFEVAYEGAHDSIRILLYELYLHNYVVPSIPNWNPLLFIGGIHLPALMSWAQNEITYGEQLRKYREKELSITLPLRPENGKPRCMYYDWLHIANGFYEKQHRARILKNRE